MEVLAGRAGALAFGGWEREARRLGDALEVVPEEALGGYAVTPHEPGDVALIGDDVPEGRGVACAQRAVSGLDLAQEHRRRPPVGEDVVAGLDHPRPFAGQSNQGDAEQGGSRQIEGGRTFLGEEGLPAPLGVGFGER
jgi:hypothetical protein